MLAFDARTARLLEPGQHLIFAEAPGLRLVATASRRAWVYRYKSPVDDRMRQTKLGEWPAMPPAAALTAWDRVRASRATGVDPAAEKRATRAARALAQANETMTVRRVCDDYLADYKGTVAAATHAGCERVFRVELGTMADRLAADIGRADAFDLLSAKRGSPVMATRLRQALGAAWDHAIDAGRLPPETPNWWRLVLKRKLPSKGRIVGGEHRGVIKRVLSEPEVSALLRWLPHFTPDIADVLTLYLWTCCRGAEIVAMARDEVTREADGYWWTVPKAKLKMRRHSLVSDLRVPLAGRAAAIVLRRLEGPDKHWLFPGCRDDGRLDQRAVALAVWRRMPYSTVPIEKCRERLPVTHWAPHDLRRTGRTMLAGLGCPAEVAEAVLGHVQPGVQAVYNRHGYDAERRLWLTRLAEHLESLAA